MKKKIIVLLSIVCGLGGCSDLPIQTNPDIGSSVTALSNATKSLQDIANDESQNKTTVRRDEAIRYWLSHGDDTTGTNLSSANPLDSFARYVCAGSGSLATAQSEIHFFSAYSAGLQAAIDPGPDTFSGQFSRFLSQNSDSPELKSPPIPTAGKAFSDCFAETKGLLTIYQLGKPASDTSDEFVLDEAGAVIEAGKALITSLQTIAKDGLKVVNDIQAREHMKQFIAKNHSELNKVEAAFLSKNTLDDSWNRRRAFVLGSAYEKFQVIISDTTPKIHGENLRASALELSSELAAFDKMQTVKKPSDAMKLWVDAANQVEKSVNDNNVSVKAIFDYLSGTEDSLKAIETDYADVNSKFGALIEKLKSNAK